MISFVSVVLLMLTKTKHKKLFALVFNLFPVREIDKKEMIFRNIK